LVTHLAELLDLAPGWVWFVAMLACPALLFVGLAFLAVALMLTGLGMMVVAGWRRGIFTGTVRVRPDERSRSLTSGAPRLSL
jgi:hypothetical protein